MTMEDQSTGLRAFHPEPGTSLATAIGELMPVHHSSEALQVVSSIPSNTESNQDSERQSLNESDNQKYKTELCRNFSAYGLCSYSSRCQFAHGFEELRGRSRHPKYKTELCRNFLAGHCKYGSRCQFLHYADETKETLQEGESPTLPYPTAAAAIGTYLLTNLLAQSALAALANDRSQPNSTLISPTLRPSDRSFRRMTVPYQCGIEMQQLHLSPRVYHGMSLPQNQNNNDYPPYQSCMNRSGDSSSEIFNG